MIIVNGQIVGQGSQFSLNDCEVREILSLSDVISGEFCPFYTRHKLRPNLFNSLLFGEIIAID